MNTPEKSYFLKIHGQDSGPFRISAVHAMWRDGRIPPEALCYLTKGADPTEGAWEPIDKIVAGVESPFDVPRLAAWGEICTSVGIGGGFLFAAVGGFLWAGGIRSAGMVMTSMGLSLLSFGVLSYVAWQVADLLGRIAASTARAAIAQEAQLARNAHAMPEYSRG